MRHHKRNTKGNARKRSKPTAMDIFCGCGGTTLGLRQAGYRVLAGVEADALAASTFRANHARVRVWQTDVRELGAEQLLKAHNLEKGALDLLAGCPPCQAFSALRRLNGHKRIRDKHGKDLVLEYLRLVEGLAPKVIMIENVPRLVEDYRFNEVRKRLRKLGYEGDPIICNAADYGVPQRRRRMVYIASRIGPVTYASPVDSSPSPSVRKAIGTMPRPGRTDDSLHDYPETHTDKVMDVIRSIPKDGGSRSSLGKDRQLDCHKKCTGFKDIYGRMAWDKVAPTITSGCTNPSKGRFLHPEQDRAVTLREAAILQSFPKDYSFSLEGGKSGAALMIGNAFPPELARAHGVAIQQALAKNK